MTPLVATGLPEIAAATAASTAIWSRHLAAIRAYYGDAWFAGCSVLALGCGPIGELVSLGAQQVSGPAGFDPDQEWSCGPVDLVLHLGLLPQLDLSHASLRHACAHASDLVIETAVCDSHDPACFVAAESQPSNHHRADPGSRIPNPGPLHFPSPARIERLLSEHGMLFQRLADSRCNGPEQVYDWLAAGTERVTPGQHRLWFARRG